MFSCGSKGASIISKSLDERMFFVDSGASMHMLSKRDQSPVEMDTLRRLRTPTTVVTANGEVQANEEAQVYVDDLGLFVTVPLLEETPAVISLGKLCKEHGYSCEWVSGQEPRLTQNGKIIICKTDNFVLLVVPGLSSASGSSSSSTSMQDMTPSASQDKDKDRSDLVALGNGSGTDSDRMDKDDRLQLPEWLEEFREHLEDQKSLCTHNTQESSNSERPTKVVVKLKLRKHSIETHFPKDRNCDVCLRTKITRNPCRRGTGEASITEAEKFGDLITADHKVLNEGRRISEQSPIRCRGARSCHSLDSVFSVPNKTSQETEKSLRKFLEPSQKPKAIYSQFVRIWQIR